MTPNVGPLKRPYRQTARASAAQDLRRRIAVAFHNLLLSRSIDEATLDEVAAIAGTTRRTVIRLFGGKDGLLQEVLETILRANAQPRLRVPADATLEASLDSLLEHYEESGDFVIRLLAQEERQPLLSEPIEIGRRSHRTWVAEQFVPPMSGLNDVSRERLVTMLVVATDVYTWKLLRRDLGRSREDVSKIMAEMIVVLTGGSPK